MSGHDREVAAAPVELSDDVMLGAEVRQHYIIFGSLRGEELLFPDRRALDRVGDDVALQLRERLPGHLGGVLDAAGKHAVFTHDLGQRAGVDAANAGNAAVF